MEKANNIRWLHQHAHLHVGLIAGLPGGKVARFARYWDLIANSGRFQQTLN
jgi:hypothetical protein